MVKVYEVMDRSALKILREASEELLARKDAGPGRDRTKFFVTKVPDEIFAFIHAEQAAGKTRLDAVALVVDGMATLISIGLAPGLVHSHPGSAKALVKHFSGLFARELASGIQSWLETDAEVDAENAKRTPEQIAADDAETEAALNQILTEMGMRVRG